MNMFYKILFISILLIFLSCSYLEEEYYKYKLNSSDSLSVINTLDYIEQYQLINYSGNIIDLYYTTTNQNGVQDGYIVKIMFVQRIEI